MSLQVWLPLTGHLNNQGLSNVTVTNNGATVDNNGKIGKCYYFNGSNQYLTNTNFEFDTSNDYSTAFWMYFTALPTGTNARPIAICKNASSAYADTVFSISIDYINNGSQGKFAIIDGGAVVYYDYSFATGVWYHIALTKQGSTKKLYMNGQLLTTLSFGGSTRSYKYLFIGGVPTNSRILNGKLNDFRIYDHALSDKEIKELSKGLVLHYPLTGGGRSGDNLAKNSMVLSPTASKSTLNISSRGAATRRLRSDGFYESCCKGDWQGLSIYANMLNLEAGDILTFSFYTYVSSSQHNMSFYPIMVNSSGTRDTTTKLYMCWDDGHSATDNALNYGWISSTTPQRHHVTFTWNSAVKSIIDNGGYIELSIQAHGGWSDGSNICFFRPKLERGNIPTPWMPNSADTAYAAMGYNSTTEYDVSGYNNHGTKTNITYSIDTARYAVASMFNGTDSRITVPFNTIVPEGSVFTINIWFKKDALGSKNYETLFGGPSGFEIDTRANSATTLSFYMASARGGNVFSPFEFSKWYMVTMVSDGTNEMYYVNGSLKKTIEKKSMPTGNYFLGAWNTATRQNYYGLMSDFRIYATALSAEDVKQLYNTAAALCNNGTLMAYEYVEV